VPVQRYISPELTHFVGKDLSEEQQYSVLVNNILKMGWLKSDPNYDTPHEVLASRGLVGPGPARVDTDAVYSQVVCFCDIPVTDLGLHMVKYSPFGLSFLKPFLVKKGANPVMYVANNSPTFSFGLPSLDSDRLWPRRDVFQGNIQLYQDFSQAILWADTSPFRESQPGKMTEEQLMFLTLNFFFSNLIFSFIKYFDDSTSDQDEANVYMEREWRVLGDVTFTLADVHRVFMPEHYAERFRTNLPTYTGQLTFSDNI
jgi:Putative abortive phage resistance protein AbiGi, antitoxin